MMSGVPLKTCWAFKKLWNNKFYYKAASCSYFYWVIYDARIHKYQINDKEIMGLKKLLIVQQQLGPVGAGISKICSLFITFRYA